MRIRCWIMYKFNKNKKLLHRFLISYLLAVLLPTVILGIVLHYYQTGRQRDEFIGNRQTLLLSAGATVETRLAHAEEISRSLSSSPWLLQFLEDIPSSDRDILYQYMKNIVPLLESLQTYKSEISEIRIYTFNQRVGDLLLDFYPIDELGEKLQGSSFELDDSVTLTNGWWNLEYREGKLWPVHYRAVLDRLYAKVIAVVEIECQPRILDPLLERGEETEEIYLLQDGEQLFSLQGSGMAGQALEQLDLQVFSSPSTEVRLWSQPPYLVEKVYLDYMKVNFVFLTPSSAVWRQAFLFEYALLPMLLFFLAANLLFLPAIFKPLHNISQLAGHMRRQEAQQLTPYDGKITHDEIGDLISAFNDMVAETDLLKEAVQRSEILRKNAQLEALQAQLNPHFFYGTLENIRMIAEAHGETLIADIAVSFGSLIRYSLARTYFVPVSEEIRIAEQYLSIQDRRVGNRFSVEWTKHLENEDFLCPKFVLFTMVENVFTHCISMTREKIRIKIKILQDAGDLYLVVENNGPPVPPERVQEIMGLLNQHEKRRDFRGACNGRGIFNIHDRLQLYYGNDYGFTFYSGAEGTRCCAHLRQLTSEEKKIFIGGENRIAEGIDCR